MSMENLGREVYGEALEHILILAARDVGLTAESKDSTYRKSNLDVSEGKVESCRAIVYLRKKGLFRKKLVAEADINKGEMRDYFFLTSYRGYDSGQYLAAVFKRLTRS